MLKKVLLTILAFIVNAAAIAICLSLSKLLYNLYTGPGKALVFFEMLPLLFCGLAFFFVWWKEPLPYFWRIIVYSFIFFMVLNNMDYLSFPLYTSSLFNLVVIPLNILLVMLASKRLFEHSTREFLMILGLFFILNVVNGFCSWHSPNTWVLVLLYKMFNIPL